MRFNISPLMTKSLRGAKILRFMLKNDFNKKRPDEKWNNRGIFVLNYSARPRKNNLVILMSK